MNIIILFYIVIEATLADTSVTEDVIFPGENSTVSELISITIPASFIQCRSEATGNNYIICATTS